MEKIRLDLLLVERGLVESRSLAQRLVMAGRVRVNGQVVLKPATTFLPEVEIRVQGGPRFVSRGGEKMAAALEAFRLPVAGRVCADVGASTGGFTDCLLQHDAARVYAVDVGRGILHWKLRNDPRVVVLESTNARYLQVLPEPVSLVTADVAFISLRTMFPVFKKWYPAAIPSLPDSPTGVQGDLIVLVKPQFEAGRREVARGAGIVRSPALHRRVLLDVLAAAQDEGYAVRGLMRSPLQGPKGNIEFLAWLDFSGENQMPIEVQVDDLFPGEDPGSL